jgi:hypothetical protein
MARRLGGLDATALIGLAGTVVAALLSAGFLGDFLVNPAVYVEVKNNATSKPYMLVTNDGSEPAHNLTLFIQSSSDKIVNVTNIFSTTNVTLVEPVSKTLDRGRPVPINNNSLQIFIPVLSSGVGSKVEIETLLESQRGGVSVTAVYDEGSTVGSETFSLVRRVSTVFSDTNIYAALIVVPGVVSVLAIIRLGVRRHLRKKSINKLVSTIECLHRKLEDDPYIPERFYLYKWHDSEDPENSSTRKWWKMRLSSIRKWWKMRLSSIRKWWKMRLPLPIAQDIMKNPKDYIIIDDLNSKLENRNKKIEKLKAIKDTSSEEYQYEVKKLNTDCLDQINKALDIEWENYY